MEELKACPFGDSEIGDILENLIPEIDAEMILKSYEKTALRRAVEICRRPTPENKPLTIEQLRQMNGEPVWVETMQEWRIVWVDHEGDCIRLYSIFNTISAKHVLDNDGRIYARKPEQEATP